MDNNSIRYAMILSRKKNMKTETKIFEKSQEKLKRVPHAVGTETEVTQVDWYTQTIQRHTLYSIQNYLSYSIGYIYA